MALTNTQKGVLGQSEAAKVIVWGSGGEVEVAWPWTDDAHRDIEGHLRRGFSAAVAIQVKTAWRLWTARRGRWLRCPFTLPKSRVFNDPRFWYFFGFMDSTTLTFRDPVFLVPAADIHARAVPQLVGNSWHFMFEASMEPGAKDRWSPYRVETRLVGKRILAVMRGLEKQNHGLLQIARVAAAPTDAGLLRLRRAA